LYNETFPENVKSPFGLHVKKGWGLQWADAVKNSVSHPEYVTFRFPIPNTIETHFAVAERYNFQMMH
jgi:hypothetical protein